MAVQSDFIKSLPYFAGLEKSVLDPIVGYVFEKKAERGEILAFEGEPSDTLYFVAEGAVKVFKTSADGKEQIFRIIRPGESFNDVPVLGGGVNLLSAGAMGQVVLNGMKKKDLEAVIKENPPVALNVIHVLSRRVQELVSLVEDFSFRHVTSRVAKMLLEYADGSLGEGRRLTQQDMAGMIGTAREMVGRSLKSLEDEGVIRIERNRIVVTDRQALRETAGVIQ
jgi:CRP/FNR family cyclic AMP-dependent transcriptional regulator